MKRITILGGATIVLLLAGLALGFGLAAGARQASAQQTPDGTATPAPWAPGWMQDHMQDMHGPDWAQDMHEHMDAVHGEGSFDRMHSQGSAGCAGTPPTSSSSAEPGVRGGMMGASSGQPGRGMMW